MGDLTIAAGDAWYFHTQMADTSGRGGYTNGLIKAQISGDEGIVEYDEETGILTGLAAGTVEVTFTVEEGRLTDRQSGEDLGQAYEGASITLTVTVTDGE